MKYLLVQNETLDHRLFYYNLKQQKGKEIDVEYFIDIINDKFQNLIVKIVSEKFKNRFSIPELKYYKINNGKVIL